MQQKSQEKEMKRLTVKLGKRDLNMKKTMLGKAILGWNKNLKGLKCGSYLTKELRQEMLGT